VSSCVSNAIFLLPYEPLIDLGWILPALVISSCLVSTGRRIAQAFRSASVSRSGDDWMLVHTAQAV
jgi:hypothetical protein